MIGKRRTQDSRISPDCPGFSYLTPEWATRSLLRPPRSKEKGIWRCYGPVNETPLPLTFADIRGNRGPERGKGSPKVTQQMKPEQLGQNQAPDFPPLSPQGARVNSDLYHHLSAALPPTPALRIFNVQPRSITELGRELLGTSPSISSSLGNPLSSWGLPPPSSAGGRVVYLEGDEFI